MRVVFNAACTSESNMEWLQENVMLSEHVRLRYDSTLSYQSHTASYDHTHTAVLSDRTPCAIVAYGVPYAWGPQIVLPPYNAFKD